MSEVVRKLRRHFEAKYGAAAMEVAMCKAYGLEAPLPSTPAGRLHMAMALAAPECVDEEGNEFTGPPLIDASTFFEILDGD